MLEVINLIEIYKKNISSIDLVILDLMMPNMPGKMVYEKLRDINPNVKVIITSGHSEKYSREGILSDIKYFLKKPFKLKEILKLTRKVLDMEK